MICFDWVLPLPDHQEFLFPLTEPGITTVVTGNCGFSPAPVTAEGKKIINDLAETLPDRPLSYEWETMGEFLDYLESGDGLIFNTIQLVGHGALHMAAVQDYIKQPNSREMTEMVGMTGKTARWLGITQRGEIKPGYFADIVIIDSDTIADNTTVEETARRPAGIANVLINGERVVENGKYVKDKKAGQVVRFR